MLERRKEMTMDKVKIKEFLEFCPDAADGLLDVLTDMELCTRTEPKESSIIEQEWHFVEDAGYAGGGQVYDADNNCVNFVKWKRQIAAAPDAYKALVRVRTLLGGFHALMPGTGELKSVKAVLKKAGVE